MSSLPNVLRKITLLDILTRFYIIYLIEGVEIGLYTSSRERLGTYFAEPTQRRVRIAGVKRNSGGS
jgi:hypothetical protein